MERPIINYFELSEDWQAEARRNLEDYEEHSYLEPLETQNPTEHILWDLSECMKAETVYEGRTYNAVIGISNNSAMLLDIDDSFESAFVIII